MTFLGTGTSFGVPQVGCDCAVCRSTDIRDKRTRCSAYIELVDGTRILIDTPPELRLQLLASGIDSVDAVLFTHEHADHVHGIDDIRALSFRNGAIPVYGSRQTLDSIAQRFAYIFDPSMKPLPGTIKPEGLMTEVRAGASFTVRGANILPLELPHGRITVLGYRIGRFAYITDAKMVPDQVVEQLKDVDVLVLNALFDTPHPGHLSLPEAIETAQRIGAKNTFLTHLSHHHSHSGLLASLPEGIVPAYDGMTITVSD